MARAKSKIAEVEMWTDRYRIVGEVHVVLRGAYKGRLSDLLNRTAPFLSLTDAAILAQVCTVGPGAG